MGNQASCTPQQIKDGKCTTANKDGSVKATSGRCDVQASLGVQDVNILKTHQGNCTVTLPTCKGIRAEGISISKDPDTDQLVISAVQQKASAMDYVRSAIDRSKAAVSEFATTGRLAIVGTLFTLGSAYAIYNA